MDLLNKEALGSPIDSLFARQISLLATSMSELNSTEKDWTQGYSALFKAGAVPSSDFGSQSSIWRMLADKSDVFKDIESISPDNLHAVAGQHKRK